MRMPKILLLASIASTLALTGCSSSLPVEPPKVELKAFKPARPTPLVLEDEIFVVCPTADRKVFICMDLPNARKVIRNKARTLVWVKDAGAVMDFYDGRTADNAGK